ncbi:hypothetical protein CPB85DRAFT_1519400 [Mucidula mucida]|nr:hypothetical protein CPB85DRAFT_1519400 [Mucidula mucida]
MLLRTWKVAQLRLWLCYPAAVSRYRACQVAATAKLRGRTRLMETTPPPEAVGLFAMAAEEVEDEEVEDLEAEDEEAPGSEHSTPTKKRPAPSRPTAGRPGKCARNAKAGTSGT